jgi:hypothetical protein
LLEPQAQGPRLPVAHCQSLSLPLRQPLHVPARDKASGMFMDNAIDRCASLAHGWASGAWEARWKLCWAQWDVDERHEPHSCYSLFCRPPSQILWEDNQFNDETIVVAIEGLGHHPRLRTLRLGDNEVADIHAKDIASALERTPLLTSLEYAWGCASPRR